MSSTGSKWTVGRIVTVGGALALGAALLIKFALPSSSKQASVPNMALVFIKPHGQVDGMQEFVEKQLAAAGLRIVQKGQLPGKAIDDNGAIDAHYAAIGNYATKTPPKELPLTDERRAEFEAKFGEAFDAAATSGRILNIVEAMKEFGWNAEELGKAFERAKKDYGMKLAPGCYIAYLKPQKKYVVNGFYATMREEYVNRKAVVSWMVVSWPQAQLSWKDFRAKVLGATDPSVAEKGSIRQLILDNAKDLGLSFTPSTGRNCVHGSASPLEALNERKIWVGTKYESDPFGAALIKAGFSPTRIAWMCSNPTVAGMPLFDLVEDFNSDECIEKLKNIVAP